MSEGTPTATATGSGTGSSSGAVDRRNAFSAVGSLAAAGLATAALL